MSTLLAAQGLSKTYVTHTLFEGVTLRLAEDDRLAIIGPNGSGKSTLLKIIAGLETPDLGDVTRRRGVSVAYVPQDDLFPDGATPLSAVMSRLEEHSHSGHHMDFATRAAIVLSKLGFVDGEQPVHTLSGGWRKRLSIACAMAIEPDVLLLDEPTNHLDVDGIVWLENLAATSRIAMAFVTHDRRFLENAAHRIIELSTAYPRGTLEVSGNYTEFVRRKEEFLDGQSAAQAALANTVRRDTAWLRQGIQARRTRIKTHIVDAESRREELKAIGERNAAPTRITTIDFQATERKTNRLLTLHGVSKSLGEKRLFNDLDLTLSPSECVGLLGPNGSGKTTLLRVIAGEIEPDAGTVKRAANLRTIMFSQHRRELVATQTLQEALCPVGDHVDYRGQPIHVSSWARKFLFHSEQLSTLVSSLSGGERARVLIAQLMLDPADVLLLDEPTNDLDIPSLEVLEQALMEFPGAIVLISHDRFMLERVSTTFLALDGRGGANSYASIAQWQQGAKAQATAIAKENDRGREPKPIDAAREEAKPRKLSFKLQREADGMEAAIMRAEAEVESLHERANDPAVVADHMRLTATYHDLHEAQARVQKLYDRWAELEAMTRE